MRVAEARHAARTVRAFIDANATDVTLTRTPLVADGAGGLVQGTPVNLPAQRMRIVESSKRVAKTRRTIDGDIVDVDVELVGYTDADVKIGDLFQQAASRYEVVYVVPDRTVRTFAELTYRGEA